MLAKPKPKPAEPEPTSAAICRSATLEDVEPLYLMIEEYAQRGIMLPRSRKVLERQIDQFVVAEINGRVVGCGSLCRLGNDLVEVRSLGLRDECKGQGIGSMIVEELTKEARRQKIPKIMALTYAVNFFLKNGFQVVNKEIFPKRYGQTASTAPSSMPATKSPYSKC